MHQYAWRHEIYLSDFAERECAEIGDNIPVFKDQIIVLFYPLIRSSASAILSMSSR